MAQLILPPFWTTLLILPISIPSILTPSRPVGVLWLPAQMGSGFPFGMSVGNAVTKPFTVCLQRNVLVESMFS